ncbi:MAG: hypothetical protein JXB49_14895 [Bacteroidales bacterium]|nr:hypothetical protein [Bacteroidales bacterium]
MASVRDIKRDINVITHELINECYAYKHFHPKSTDKINKKIAEILKKRNELIHRVNNPDDDSDSKQIRKHFNKIAADLEGIIKLLDNLE